MAAVTICNDIVAAKSLQSFPTLWDPIDGSPLGSSVPRILQARILEWVDISVSNAWKWTVKVKSLSRALLLATPWTGAYQAPPPMGFSKQEHWSGFPFPSPMHESEQWKWSRSVVSDSSRPNVLQPTRLLRPWDLPGKSTGVGCQWWVSPRKSPRLWGWSWSLSPLQCHKPPSIVHQALLSNLVP